MTSNIGCVMQLEAGAGVPFVHIVELLDWATGGPIPPQLVGLRDQGHRIEALVEMAKEAALSALAEYSLSLHSTHYLPLVGRSDDA